MRTARFFVIIAGAAGLLGTACGSDTEALTKPEFVEQADAICQATNDELEPVFDAVWEGWEDWDPEDPDDQLLVFARFDEAMDTAEPAILRQLDDIRALEPPKDDKELIHALLDDVEAAVKEFAGRTEAAAAGDQAAMAFLDSENEDPFEETDLRARQYGLTVCGEEG